MSMVYTSDRTGNFIGLATLPLQDTREVLRVLDEAILKHRLAGVCIHSNVAERHTRPLSFDADCDPHRGASGS
jgi:hypothetical protein